MAALLGFYEVHDAPRPAPDFVLMQHIDGIEIGVGGYFNGKEFLETARIDFEHKRIFPGELGELTGEMGTVVSYAASAKLRDLVLKPLTNILRDGGYCGYINVNLMTNADGLWPLEFTSRFGYPGYAICERLHLDPWEDIFLKMIHRSGSKFQTSSDFAAGTVITVPPFPYKHGYEEISKGIPVILDKSLSRAERAAIAFAEVKLRQGALITSGTCGYLGVVTGCAPTVDAAHASAMDVVGRVFVPNLRYRNDIGSRVSVHRLAELREWGFL